MNTARVWKKYRAVSYKVWLGLFLVCAVTTIFALRANNQQMVKLRNNVYAADKANSNVEAALDKLRAYVYGHMNTDLTSGGTSIYPPIQLEYTYQRLEAKAQSAANNKDLYSVAESYCEAKIPSLNYLYLRPRVACAEDYISSHGGKAPAAIPAALYEYNFASPVWSPDFAGWMIVVTLLFFGLLIVSLLALLI